MYVPQHFREERTEVIHDLIEANSFATVVSNTSRGLFATHIPILLDRGRGELGTLRGHVARANPHWEELAASEALVIFGGPHAYISPSWYASSGRVPTWNYIAVHAYGTPRLIEDDAGLRAILDRTIATYERGLEPPWTIDRVEPGAVNAMLGSIVGFEMPIARLEGKRKLNQNRSRADREGAIAGLRAHGRDDSAEIADLMEADLRAVAR